MNERRRRSIPLQASAEELVIYDEDARVLGVSRTAVLQAYLAFARERCAGHLDDVRRYLPVRDFGRGRPKSQRQPSEDPDANPEEP